MTTSSAPRIAKVSRFCEADAAMDRIKDRLLSPEAQGMSLTDIERMLTTEGHELMRALLQGYLDQRTAQEQVVEVTGADGVARTQIRKATRRVETPHGEVAVTRNLYQAPGSEGLAPLDAALG